MVGVMVMVLHTYVEGEKNGKGLYLLVLEACENQYPLVHDVSLHDPFPSNNEIGVMIKMSFFFFLVWYSFIILLFQWCLVSLLFVFELNVGAIINYDVFNGVDWIFGFFLLLPHITWNRLRGILLFFCFWVSCCRLC